MMRNFLSRLLGSPRRSQHEEKRFRDNLRALEDRGAELDRLSEQLEGMEEASKSKQSSLSTTATDLAATLTRSRSSHKMKAVMNDEEEDDLDGRLSELAAIAH